MENTQIDELVAEHIFEWKWVKGFPDLEKHFIIRVYADGRGERTLVSPSTYEYISQMHQEDDVTLCHAEHFHVPKYSCNMTDAWKIVEKMKSEYHFNIRNEEPGCMVKYVVDISSWYPGVNDIVIEGIKQETAPLAICKAALLIKGIKIDGE